MSKILFSLLSNSKVFGLVLKKKKKEKKKKKKKRNFRWD